MSGSARFGRCLALLVALGLAARALEGLEERLGGQEEQAPGVSIRRAQPRPGEREQLNKLAEWRSRFERQLEPVRRLVGELFLSLESSSLASQSSRCAALLAALDDVDRTALLPSPEARVDRVLVGVLERFRSGSVECILGRNLIAFRLLEEASAGVRWIDLHLDRRFREPVRLPGLEDPE